MRRRNDGEVGFLQKDFGQLCFHSLGLIDQNREYLGMHLLASADLPTRQALSDIQVESARMERAVHNFMMLGHLEGEEPEELRPFDLCGLLEKTGRLAPDIESAVEVKLTVEWNGIRQCNVMAVPDQTEQLLLHLISNALRACDAGGRVWVSLQQRKSGVVLRVEDDGCGLAEDDPIENHRRFLGGSRIGLRICRLICRRAGWKLTLTSRPGGGARAQVTFPLAECQGILPEMELHSGAEDEIAAARFASRAARELLLLRRY